MIILMQFFFQLKMTALSPLVTVVMLIVVAQGEDLDLSTGDSSLHYSYNHAYGYEDHHTPYHGYKHKYGHHHAGLGYAEGHHRSYGNHHAEFHDYTPPYGYGHPPAHLPIPAPHHHGYVPHPHDHVEGRAYGHDLVGPFYHHSGPFGPFGFYANFYHD